MAIASTSTLPAANTVLGATAATEGKKKGSLTQEDFLSLLMTQMRFQNPLEPMDSYQMASQMAQLSTVEAMNQMSQSMKSLETNQASAASLQSMGLVGKKVEVEGNVISVDGGKMSDASYQLATPGKVKVLIYQANGRLVRTLEEGLKDSSRQTIAWDGKGEKGAGLPDGEYFFRVAAADEKGQSVQASTYMKATVNGVAFENGIPYLQIGSQRVPLKNVTAILS